ncbi:MAG: right-handed parallel beta-helix repeat-containing protein [Actinomycetota bacterium]|nr:right-handed parallel beta-helix repeat-containing protein [Actinomycetota bacterium]
MIRRCTTRRLAVLGSMTLVASLGFAGSSSAAPSKANFKSFTGSCGKAVTDPKAQHPVFVLQNDIGPCKSDGLIFKASNVTLDLRGHTIKGMPLETDSDGKITGGFGEGVGLRLVGNSRVKVISTLPGATIQDFDAGMVIQGGATQPATDNSVSDIRFTNNRGRQVFGSGTEEEISDFNDGLAIVNSQFNTIGPNNVFDLNGSGGIRIDDRATNNTVVGNTADGNGGNGIRFLPGATSNLVKGNTSRNNTFSGVAISFESADNIIDGNIIHSNRSFGVSTSYLAERTIIRNNEITNNRNGGITLGSGQNTVSKNRVIGNGKGASGTGRGNGIFVGSGTDNFPRVGTTVSENTVQGNGGNGIRIGCMIDQATHEGGFVQSGCLNWDMHNKVLDNVATGNAVNGPPGTKVFLGFQVVGWYDLLDSTNADATQSPEDPSGVPLRECSNNTWSGNSYNTAYPACTTG